MENQKVILIMETSNNSYESDELINISDTAMVEYLDVIKSEYENERNKKQSFENRAGLIVALLGAICIFLFEKVQVTEMLQLFTVPINFLILLKIVSGVMVYISFVFTLIMLVSTITIQKHHNFEVKSIDEELLTEERMVALNRIILTYKDIIIQHRERNEERAKVFRNSLYGTSLTLISIMVYVSIVL